MSQTITRRSAVLIAAGAAGVTAAGLVGWSRFDIGGRFFNPLRLDTLALKPVAGLTRADGAPSPGFGAPDFAEHPRLVVLFASWCPPCRDEHPTLHALAKRLDAPIYGALYRDSAEGAANFLRMFGNPFAAIGDDSNGYFARLVGARGVPATLVVAPGPKIALRIDGPLDAKIIEDKLMPALRG